MLARRAERSLTASLTYDIGPYQLGADFLAQSRRKESEFSDVYNAGYGLMHLTAEWHVQRDWRITVLIETEFDKKYELADGFYTARSSVMIEARYHPAS